MNVNMIIIFAFQKYLQPTIQSNHKFRLSHITASTRWRVGGTRSGLYLQKFHQPKLSIKEQLHQTSVEDNIIPYYGGAYRGVIITARTVSLPYHLRPCVLDLIRLIDRILLYRLRKEKHRGIGGYIDIPRHAYPGLF